MSEKRKAIAGEDLPDSTPINLTPHAIALNDGKSFDLYLPQEFQITPAAQGLKRIRAMAKSPDGRLFVPDMIDLSDNNDGAIYILDDFDATRGTFGKAATYLTELRNPNSLTFYTDDAGKHWLYLALTDRLVRYPYRTGDLKPSSPPQTIATFPDRGLSYKYGGWHLTRTVEIHNNKVYVSIGSSCDACEETEAVRASILEMDLDGRNSRPYATGLRNAVGIKWVSKAGIENLFATNMGSDYLGEDKPEDTFYLVEDGKNYGWPYCYQFEAQIYADEEFSRSDRAIDCRKVPLADATFPAHSAPLGFAYFDSTNTISSLKNYFLVALHGSSEVSLNRGYEIVRVAKGRSPEPFVTGFLQNGVVYGRPAFILPWGTNAFLVTDDRAGVVYFISPK
ncbi:PQQ-dependent sugar dehydrogenase [Tumidithrix helvetica]|uniref:PQQ-dependent sugar dehydrogenase n=1 Tax=Tumidithrix helvetica TaxID=3457545 RepID=UPI003CC59A8B